MTVHDNDHRQGGRCPLRLRRGSPSRSGRRCARFGRWLNAVCSIASSAAIRCAGDLCPHRTAPLLHPGRSTPAPITRARLLLGPRRCTVDQEQSAVCSACNPHRRFALAGPGLADCRIAVLRLSHRTLNGLRNRTEVRLRQRIAKVHEMAAVARIARWVSSFVHPSRAASLHGPRARVSVSSPRVDARFARPNTPASRGSCKTSHPVPIMAGGRAGGCKQKSHPKVAFSISNQQLTEV